MRLIIATGIYPPDIGGPATYSKKIAEEFSKRGLDVKVLTYADSIFSNRDIFARGKIPPTPPLEKGGDLKVIQVPRSHNIFARYFLYTRKLCKLAKTADLIYAQGPVSEGLPAYLASKLTGKGYVLKIVGDPSWERMGGAIVPVSRYEKQGCGTVYASGRKQIGCHSPNPPVVGFGTMTPSKRFLDLDEFQGIKNLPVKTKMLRWVERLVAKNAKKIITPSEYLRKIVMGWGVEEEKIKVIYNAVDTVESADSMLNTPLTPLKGGDKEDIILSAGRLVPWKGFDLLIDIMPELLKVNANFKLVIVGDGPENERLLNRRDEALPRLYSEDKIILTGKLEHEELLDLMRTAKMFILNSGYEGLSHAVIEAMQIGIPCAISNKGGNPELVEDGKTGLLFEYNNREQIISAIKRLWKDENLRERVAAAGYEKIKEFGFERMVEETMETLTD